MRASNFLLSAVIVVVIGLASATLTGGTNKNDQELLQGTWLVTKTEFEGKDSPNKSPTKWVIEGEKLKVISTEKASQEGFSQEGIFKLAAAKNPKEIDILITFPVDKEKAKDDQVKYQTVKGIYSLDGDTLNLALGKRGGERLDKFSSAGKGNRVLYLQRTK